MRDMSDGRGAASAHVVVFVVGEVEFVVGGVVEVFALICGGVASSGIVESWVHVGGGVASSGRVE